MIKMNAGWCADSIMAQQQMMTCAMRSFGCDSPVSKAAAHALLSHPEGVQRYA